MLSAENTWRIIFPSFMASSPNFASQFTRRTASTETRATYYPLHCAILLYDYEAACALLADGANPDAPFEYFCE